MKRPVEIENTTRAKRDRGRKASVSTARKISKKPAALTHEEVVAKYCVPITDEEYAQRLAFQSNMGAFEPNLSIYYNDMSKFEDRQKRFLLALATVGLVREACHAARVSRRELAEWMKEDNFREAYEDAEEDATDDLEMHAMERAKNQSDPLMALLLKARRPDRYMERSLSEIVKNRGAKKQERQKWQIGELSLEF